MISWGSVSPVYNLVLTVFSRSKIFFSLFFVTYRESFDVMVVQSLTDICCCCCTYGHSLYMRLRASIWREPIYWNHQFHCPVQPSVLSGFIIFSSSVWFHLCSLKYHFWSWLFYILYCKSSLFRHLILFNALPSLLYQYSNYSGAFI
jgi:hypothetical protein